MNRKIFVSWIVSLLTLVGCGNGGAGNATAPGQFPPPPPPISKTEPDCDQPNPVKSSDVDALPGGLWFGSIINCVTNKRSDYARAWVTEDGRFRIFGPDWLVLRGQLGTDGDTFSGAGREFSVISPSDRRGANLVSTGYIAERVNLDGRWSTDTASSGAFALSYDSGYHLLPAIFDELPGTRATWELFSNAEGVWTIEPGGRFNGQDDRGCAQSGEFRLIDSRYNLYEIEYTVVGCAGAGSYSGLATVGKDGLTGDRLLEISVDDGDQRAYQILFYF